MKFLIPKDSVRLISSILRYLSGEAYICFESNIHPSEFGHIITTNNRIIPLIKRENPESKYIVVLPLDDNTCEFILKKNNSF
jgi:hypothetical protein